ncbi:serine hydrolase [Tolypothrix sp. FACHB-123]|uniref:serine hydrolase n=1 Tax=Tolypothrix sp. FACHB-123 TaxID=2692868 RepID=UPI001683EE41|nr:serine hydrolase [Tolypothrix sp. FACHB-123]MBD2357738.1 serine hydrolase [Tolypothrix sp. FACHB-123]
MSESSDKLRAFSRRPPGNRRQRPRKVQNVEAKKVKAPNQKRGVAKEAQITYITKPVNSSPMTTGVSRSKSGSKNGLVMPTAVKPIPRTRVAAPQVQSGTVKMKTVRVDPRSPRGTRNPVRSRKTRLKPMARTLLYTMRLLIVGVGIGAIMGTLLSVLDPATRMAPSSSTPANTNVGQSQNQNTPNGGTPSGLNLSQENFQLKSAVQNLVAANPNLTPGVMLVDLDTGSYVDINSNASFPAASTIKIPILVAFFQDLDAGKIRLDEMLTMQQQMIAGGSGNMQYKPAGTQFTALEVASKMITISDNTATNMLIARLGGIEALNQRFRSWGLTTTAIRNQLPDLQGTNTTSPKELATLMAMVHQGNLVNMRSRDRLLDIMRQTQRDELLPSGLGAGATIAHKTGDIGTMLADAGLVDIPTGKRYIAAVMVQRPNNDSRAQKLISAISRTTYQQFSQNNLLPNSAVPNSAVPIPTNNMPTNTMPATGYQSPMMAPTVPMNGYPPPVMTPYPNGMVNPMPNTVYPSSPMMNPPYYPPR